VDGYSLSNNKITKKGAEVFDKATSRYEIAGYDPDTAARMRMGAQRAVLTYSIVSSVRWAGRSEPQEKAGAYALAIVAKDLPAEQRVRPMRAKPKRSATRRPRGRACASREC
jgi:hypothetical protein